MSSSVQRATVQKFVLRALTSTEDEEQNLSQNVHDTFLHVEDESEEAQKAQQTKQSCSGLIVGPQCPNDKECDCPRGEGLNTTLPVLNSVALDRDQLQLRNAPRKPLLGLPLQQVRSRLDSNGLLQFVLSPPLNPCTSSPSSNQGDGILGLPAEKPNIVRQKHPDGQRSTHQDALPAPNKPSWSAGAVGHEEGTCKPCAWNWKPNGCSKGALCPFCHMCARETLTEQKKNYQSSDENKEKGGRGCESPT